MEQDERTVVLRAQEMVRESVSVHGQVLPGAVMLVARDPQTGAPLPKRQAIGLTLDQPFESPDELASFVNELRIEALRLDASAVALVGEATADIVDGTPMRVTLIRVEDEGGVDLMHAKIEEGRVGAFLESPGAPDILDEPILPRAPH